MSAPVFVDANVILYASDSSEPHKQRRARDWLDRLWRERTGRTSLQVLSEVYVNLKRKAGAGVAPQEAWARVAGYLAWDPQAIDAALFRRAGEIEARWKISWWDSLVVAAAQAQDCALLLTEDLQNGMIFGSVTVHSPFAAEAHEPPAGYAVRAAASSPHRPRGRPRRRAALTA